MQFHFLRGCCCIFSSKNGPLKCQIQGRLRTILIHGFVRPLFWPISLPICISTSNPQSGQLTENAAPAIRPVLGNSTIFPSIVECQCQLAISCHWSNRHNWKGPFEGLPPTIWFGSDWLIIWGIFYSTLSCGPTSQQSFVNWTLWCLQMGGMLASCQSEEVREQLSKSKAIEKQLNNDRRAASSIIKLDGIVAFNFKSKQFLTIRLLLLGAGECGKSTVLKQMQSVIGGMGLGGIIQSKLCSS